jgi:hypothetical protein
MQRVLACLLVYVAPAQADGCPANVLKQHPPMPRRVLSAHKACGLQVASAMCVYGVPPTLLSAMHNSMKAMPRDVEAAAQPAPPRLLPPTSHISSSKRGRQPPAPNTRPQFPSPGAGAADPATYAAAPARSRRLWPMQNSPAARKTCHCMHGTRMATCACVFHLVRCASWGQSLCHRLLLLGRQQCPCAGGQQQGPGPCCSAKAMMTGHILQRSSGPAGAMPAAAGPADIQRLARQSAAAAEKRQVQQ